MPKALAFLIVLFLNFPLLWSQQTAAPGTWQFAVSGDSRNCGDVVMPAIARSVLEHHAAFYWHLGDFRAMSGVDEDMQKRYDGKLPLQEYWRIAWGDFLANQVAPFGLLPVHLGIGNHELAGNKIPADFITEFAYWLDTPDLRAQRLEENPQDGALKPYFHFKQNNVDFIYLDNAGEEGFDEVQLRWFEHILERDKLDKGVLTIVVGMHRALPNSLACGHSMNGDPKNENANSLASGRKAYSDLVTWKKESGKFVYVLASHSHFFMQDLFDTAYWKNPQHGGEVLPGWIVGTAGARRYQLPDLTEDQMKKTKAKTYVSGYLLGTVQKTGEIRFDFQELGQDQVPQEIRERYGDDFVDSFCFQGNRDDKSHPPAPSCQDQ